VERGWGVKKLEPKLSDKASEAQNLISEEAIEQSVPTYLFLQLCSSKGYIASFWF